MSREVARAHILTLIPILLPIEAKSIRVSREGALAQLSILWIKSLFNIDPRSDDYIITPLCLAFIGISLAKATFDPALIQFLGAINVYASNAAFMITTDDLRRLEVMVLNYLKVIK
jgi:hypothetical protein